LPDTIGTEYVRSARLQILLTVVVAALVAMAAPQLGLPLPGQFLGRRVHSLRKILRLDQARDRMIDSYASYRSACRVLAAKF